MQRESRKRRVGIVTPPDARVLMTPRTPSPKRYRKENGDNLEMGEANLRARQDEKHYKVFNDSIHGHIEVHPLCVEIIDTPQFQRLRDIKQLGGCYRVFPGASHNRFEHCIGTCYLAGRLVKSLRKRQPELGITDEDMLCVRIAGLCHDLGHGPFSHTFGALFIPTARPDAHWKHEDASVRMFDHMMMRNKLSPSFEKYNLTERDVTFIKELIAATVLETTICTSEDWPYKGRGPEKSYLYEIVANKRTGIDVDKFDYFSRDCHCLGINNSFDHKRYMKFARVINVSGKLQICVRDKEAGNVYDMFHTRNSLFRRAYQHKTSNIIERMITEALLKADRKVLFKGSNGSFSCISTGKKNCLGGSINKPAFYFFPTKESSRGKDESRKTDNLTKTTDGFCGNLKVRRSASKIAWCVAGFKHQGKIYDNSFSIFSSFVRKMFSISECIDDMEAYSQLSDHVYYQILNSSDPALEEARKILLRIQRRDLYKCIGHSIFRERRDEKEIPDIQLDIAGYIEDGPKLDPEDFIIDMVTFDYGMKDRNPIDEVRFYGKSNPDKPLFFRKDEVSNMLPEMFAEQHIRVYFRKNDPKLLEKAQRCFLRWCGRQKCTTPKGGDALAELTPMKSAQQGGPSNMERRLSYQE
ncbi:unnamed protein product [Pocillopora meandrina]|uniref:HD domain-containing protein n=1 Tax=Pocillopora meandrina TaxID=46732 RepID=A0AAU9VK67_9CNID|nr:unnamed protein product [Pocillopora meandrina]